MRRVRGGMPHTLGLIWQRYNRISILGYQSLDINMWEILLTVGVGEFVLEKRLDLGKSSLEDDVKDF